MLPSARLLMGMPSLTMAFQRRGSLGSVGSRNSNKPLFLTDEYATAKAGGEEVRR
jgi:hypothetical protein